MDTNQVALGHLLLSFAAVYAAGQDDLPRESETLWMFVDFIAEELQKVEARSPAVLLGMLQLLHTLVRTEPDVVWARLHSRGGMVMVGDMVAGASGVSAWWLTRRMLTARLLRRRHAGVPQPVCR